MLTGALVMSSRSIGHLIVTPPAIPAVMLSPKARVACMLAGISLTFAPIGALPRSLPVAIIRHSLREIGSTLNRHGILR